MLRALRPYGILILILFVLRIAVSQLRVDPKFALFSTVVLSAVFLAVPIYALFIAGKAPWQPKIAGLFVVVGLILHVLWVVVNRSVALAPIGQAILEAVGQTGIMIWCTGLGALLASLIKDRNILIPVALFLMGLDAYLILSPTSIPKQIMSQRPDVFEAVAVRLPGVGIGPATYVGPADFFFLTMFFVALTKFKMKVQETLLWMIPVLFAYLMLVLFGGGTQLGPVSLGALPALVPMGLTLLLVNRTEFKMKSDEKAATWVVACIALLLAGFGYRNAMQANMAEPLKPSVISPSATSPAPQK